jgi:hypothetical protein
MSQDWVKRYEADLARQRQEEAKQKKEETAANAAYYAELERKEWEDYQRDYKCWICGTPPFTYAISLSGDEDNREEHHIAPHSGTLRSCGITVCGQCKNFVCARCHIMPSNGTTWCRRCLGY